MVVDVVLSLMAAGYTKCVALNILYGIEYLRNLAVCLECFRLFQLCGGYVFGFMHTIDKVDHILDHLTMP